MRLVLLIVAGFIAVLFLLQDRIIFPGAATQGTPQSIVRPEPGSTLLTLATKRGERVVALYGPAPVPTAAPIPIPDRSRHSSSSTATRCAWPLPSRYSTGFAASA